MSGSSVTQLAFQNLWPHLIASLVAPFDFRHGYVLLSWNWPEIGVVLDAWNSLPSQQVLEFPFGQTVRMSISICACFLTLRSLYYATTKHKRLAKQDSKSISCKVCI